MPNSESYSAMSPLCPVAAAARPAMAHIGFGYNQALNPGGPSCQTGSRTAP